MKKSFIESNFNLLSTEYHYTPNGSRILIYICRCKTPNCTNNIRIWAGSRKHSGYCNNCVDIKARRAPYTYLYRAFLNSQKHKKMQVDLSFAEFTAFCEEKTCHYCNAPTIRDKHRQKKQSNAYMIDRKDNSLPYTKDNCVSCCWYCNNLKSDRFTYDEFLKLRSFIKQKFNR